MSYNNNPDYKSRLLWKGEVFCTVFRMNSNALLRLIGAAGSEKVLIDTLVKDLGIKTFLENADSIVLSNKTKRAIEWLNNILYQKENIVESLSGLTEIPVKFILHTHHSVEEVLSMKDHPEKLDIDARQLYKLHCLKEVVTIFTFEQTRERSDNVVFAENENDEEEIVD